MDTIILNKLKLVQTFKDKKFQTLITLSGDTIIKDAGYYFKLKFLDINGDGYKDIRAFVFGDTPNQCENYLYDKQSKKFKLVEDCDMDIQLIKGTQYYYSYNRSGCGDMNWESYLSKIKNYKLVSLGYMYGEGCITLSRDPRTITITKLQSPEKGKNRHIAKLSYSKHIPRLGDKWFFIRNYWTNNYRIFLN